MSERPNGFEKVNLLVAKCLRTADYSCVQGADQIGASAYVRWRCRGALGREACAGTACSNLRLSLPLARSRRRASSNEVISS